MQKYFELIPDRSCGDCKACCEGWLSAQVYETNMHPGKPCHYVSEKGCSIYKDRPENPCKVFSCLWLSNKNVPGWLKPNVCGTIMVLREEEGFVYLYAHYAGKEIDSRVLSWLFQEHVNKNLNIVYDLHNSLFYFGSNDFCSFAKKKFNLL